MDVSTETKWGFWKRLTQYEPKKSTLQKIGCEFAELFSSQSEPRIETFALASCFLVITGAMDEKLCIGVTGCH